MARHDTYAALATVANDDTFLLWDTSAAAVRKVRADDLAAFMGSVTSVASVDAPESIRRRATFKCDGTDDHVQIQAALDAEQWGASASPAAVLLSPGRFTPGDSISVHRGQHLQGAGRGATVLTAPSGTSFSNDYFIVNADETGGNLITISDLWLDGSYEAVGGIHLTNYDETFSAPLLSGSDSVHTIRDVYIDKTGSASVTRHGLWLDGTGGAVQHSRGNQITRVRVREARGDGVRLESSSDAYVAQVLSNTNRSGGGVGIRVGGGSCKFVQVKTAYTEGDGWLIESARALLSGCYAQDAGGYGYNITAGEAQLTGCTADSSNRLGTGDAGVRIAASSVLYTGFSIDRNHTPASRQAYGFRYASGNHVSINALTDNNETGPEVGAWSGATQRRVYLMDTTLGSLESVSLPTTFM